MHCMLQSETYGDCSFTLEMVMLPVSTLVYLCDSQLSAMVSASVADVNN